PHEGKVSLTIFNILGEKVATLVNQYMYAGNYEIKFDASHYASGIYFYRLDAGLYSSVKKMILMK
ncbi:MAG: T9SS type A sorting domain-containing protein, partial [Ignavibacteriaceae bacterium]|nr:T9SS type A sorting domain-containing protein [Ignavibacteriaceae bacterium]